jgi:hypothetical protein
MAQNLAVSPAYSEVSPQQAQVLANEGRAVIGAWFNPKGHGHVVTVRPEGVAGDKPVGNRGPLLNDIGAFDRVAPQSAAFRSGDKIYYYSPSGGGAR